MNQEMIPSCSRRTLLRVGLGLGMIGAFPPIALPYFNAFIARVKAMISRSATPLLSTEVTTQCSPSGVTIVMQAGTKRLHLNATAYHICALCNGHNSVSAIAHIIARTYNLTFYQALGDTQFVISILKAFGVMKV